LVPVIPGADWGDLLDFALIPGEPDEAVVARQGGQLYRVSLSGAFAPQEYGVVPNVKSGGEEGLLSIVFSPNFETDGRLYAYYTTGAPNPSRISRFDATATGFDPDSEVVILEIPQPYANHNGGKLMFGQDGYLYLSLGDGGGARDPLETGQDNTDLLGSVLRLKVTGEDTYAVPPDNPFADPGDPGHDLVWAYGLRNPWRMSADRLTGDIWLGDVGQGNWEEVDRIVAGGNYGWDCKEGFADLETAGCPPESAFVPPRAAYPNPEMGRAVTGGYVYRGDDIPSLYGQYIFADAYSGRIWAVSPEGDDPPVELMDTQYFISSFAELPDGELLVLTFGAGIFRLSE
jgi:glucose/arabinose dehydrogenase